MNVTQSTFSLLILSMVLLSLALVSAPLILATSEQSGALKEFQKAEQQFKEVFAAIREAEAAGAEENQIAALIERLNLALDLIEQGNPTNMDEAASQATKILQELKDEANQLRDAALTSSYYNKILLFIMVPVAAMIVTICIHYGLKWWRRSEVERVMKMEIKEK